MKKLLYHSMFTNVVLFLFGGLTYGFLEILWRRRTHVSMVITGGLCFLLLFRIFEKFKGISLFAKCVIGSALITTLEFICGCIVNLWLNLKVWDYSKLWCNLLGQVCLLYSFLWFLLTIPISVICVKISRLELFRQHRQTPK